MAGTRAELDAQEEWEQGEEHFQEGKSCIEDAVE